MRWEFRSKIVTSQEDWDNDKIETGGEGMKTVQQMNTDELTALLRSDNATFKASLSIKSREELLLLLGNIVDAHHASKKGETMNYGGKAQDALNQHRTWRATALGEALDAAAQHLPEGWQIHITVEQGAGWAKLYNAEGTRVDDFDNTDLDLRGSILRGIRLAQKAVHVCKPSCHNPCLLDD
jgi:hypothetical protein